MTQNKFTRYCARKLSLSEISKGSYVQGKDDEPSFLLTATNQQVFRVNLICIVIDKEIAGTITNLLCEDGTGTLQVRSFEESSSLEKINVGDVIVIVGRIRQYSQEFYCSPETIKKIDPLWLKHRSLELKIKKNQLEDKNEAIEDINENTKNVNQNVLQQDKEIINEEVKDNEEKDCNIIEDESLPNEKIINMIKDLDKGQGVLVEEIIEKSALKNTNELIDEMLKKGDLYQNSPGKIKIL